MGQETHLDGPLAAPVLVGSRLQCKPS